MPITLIAVTAIIAYLLGLALLARDVFAENNRTYSAYPGWCATLLHGVFLTLNILENQRLDFSFFHMASVISFIVAFLLMLANLGKPLEKLGIAVFPTAALMLALSLFLPETSQSINNHSWQMSSHIFSSIIAFSLLNIAALQAIFLAIQEKQLRKHPPRKIILTMPPLQTMESLLFQMITTGVIFLTLSLVSGFIFIDDLFAQHLAHKTVLSILAWLIFSALLFGRSLYGWRGRTAIRWTLSGFISLLLAYFGSKFVLELIL